MKNEETANHGSHLKVEKRKFDEALRKMLRAEPIKRDAIATKKGKTQRSK